MGAAKAGAGGGAVNATGGGGAAGGPHAPAEGERGPAVSHAPLHALAATKINSADFDAMTELRCIITLCRAERAGVTLRNMRADPR